MERVNRQERVVAAIRRGLLLVAGMLVVTGVPAQALVVCARADPNTGLARANAKLVLRAECKARKELALGIEVSGSPGTDGKVVFTGVNVQVLDGSGDTSGDPNGLGNLIVGYNEDAEPANARSGSHNLIVGREHAYSSFGAVVGGQGNTAKGNEVLVAGFANIASGEASSASGGEFNVASGSSASVSGGAGQLASGTFAWVGGGQGNVADGPHASVSGGLANTASGDRSSVSGGYDNHATGEACSVVGGEKNTAGPIFGASVGGGYGNTASNFHASVSGGSGGSAPDVASWRGGSYFSK